jgi:TonB family protein
MSVALAHRSTMAMVSFRAPVLPWTVARDDELRFRRISRRILTTCAIVCMALPWLPVYQPDRSQVQEVPLPMAKLLLDNVVKLPVDKPAPVPLPAPERKAVAEPPKSVALNKEKPVSEARVPLPNKPPGELDAARRKAAGVGLLAMKDTLAELHGAPVAVQLKEDIKLGPGVGVGTGVGAGVGAGSGLGLPTRAMITSNATGGSGGINTASYSRDTGGGGLAGRSTTLVEGVIGGGGSGGAGGGGARGRGDGNGSGIGGGGAGPGGVIQRAGSGKASRSIEDIKIVFERNKGAIYAIYNRALRAEPSLQGKVVLKLTIAPSGGVVDCRIESSELRQPDLETKLLARIRQFDFGAKDVDQMVVTWPVDFLPS